ncbi:hypothetical protein ACOMHN_033008 [Nucella lapillus]
MKMSTLTFRSRAGGALFGLVLVMMFWGDNMFLRGGGDIQLLRCGDVEANPGPNPEPSTSRPSTSLRQTRISTPMISTPRKSSQSAKDPSLSEVMATLNSINSSLNDKMDGMNASLNGKMDGVKEDVGQLHQEFGTLSELPHTKYVFYK